MRFVALLTLSLASLAAAVPAFHRTKWDPEAFHQTLDLAIPSHIETIDNILSKYPVNFGPRAYLSSPNEYIRDMKTFFAEYQALSQGNEYLTELVRAYRRQSGKYLELEAMCRPLRLKEFQLKEFAKQMWNVRYWVDMQTFIDELNRVDAQGERGWWGKEITQRRTRLLFERDQTKDWYSSKTKTKIGLAEWWEKEIQWQVNEMRIEVFEKY